MLSDLQRIFDWKTYVLTALAIISFSNFIVVLFGQTIPGIFIAFFKIAGEYVVLGTALFTKRNQDNIRLTIKEFLFRSKLSILKIKK